jgi:mannose-1-phosphate guanylyltransferase / phosphomannomutase
MQAAIIAGGLGTRAAVLTGNKIPKALLPIAGVPIIFRQMRVLAREGVKHLSVLAGYLGDQFGLLLAPEAKALGLSLNIIVESQPLGTAGCLTALTDFGENILIVYGDMLFDLKLDSLEEFHRQQGCVLTIVAHPNDHPRTSDLVVERNGLAVAILPRSQHRVEDHRNLVPAGIYLAAPVFFRHLTAGSMADMIHDVLPALLGRGVPIAVYNTPEYMRDTGTPQRHALAEQDIVAGCVESINRSHLRPAVFFDCDGVLNQEDGIGGALKPDDVTLIDGAAAAVRRAHEAGLLTVAITNRSQVAKGLITFDDLDHILGRLEALLATEGGVLDRLYFCPHHPQSGFPGEVPALKIRCECRKPGTLLLRQACADLPIERSRSIFIGDSLRDIGAARGVGIWAYGVRTGWGCRDRESFLREVGPPLPIADLMFENVVEAVDFAVRYRELAQSSVQALVTILKERQPAIIAVCGRSRSGKSTVAHAIERTLNEGGVPAIRICLDDWIKPAVERVPRAMAEDRNRVDELHFIITALRDGKPVRAPGYDPVSRGASPPRVYDPSDRSAIVLDGSFSAHRAVRKMIDFTVFVETPLATQESRFAAFYRWKGLDGDTAGTLWQQRTQDEWPPVDQQREGADVIISSSADAS